jgi:hypothetical protein
MAVGPLLKSTSKTSNPSLLKKSFLSAMDSGRSESVGASTQMMMTFVASAEKLWRERNSEPRKKIDKNISQVWHLIAFSPVSAATDCRAELI